MKAGTKDVMKMLAVVNVLGIFAAGHVMAYDAGRKDNYGMLKAGVFEPTDDLDDADFDAGGNIAAVYGRYLTPYLIVEGVIDLFGTENDVRGINDNAGSYDLDNDLGVLGFLINLKGEVPLGPVSLFGGIGVGIYAVTLDSDIDTARFGNFDTDDSDAVFGGQVVAGANFDITDRFFIGVEGTYRLTDDVDLFDSVATIPVEYSGDLNGYTVTFNAGYRF